MLERSNGALQSEIRAAKRVIAPHLETLDQDYRQIAGLAYGDAKNEDLMDEPENHRAMWLRQFHSDNTLGTPECHIEPGGQEWPESRAEIIEQAINRMSNQSGMKTMRHRVASDYAVRFAASACALAPMPGYEHEKDAPYTCTAARLAVGDYLFDATAWDRADGIWEGHRISRPISQVIAEAEQDKSLGWNLKALRVLEKQLDLDAKKKEKAGNNAVIERRDLVYWPMWERCGYLENSPGPDKGYFGAVHFCLDDSIAYTGDELIRESEPWFGSRSGPYAVNASMWVGDLPIGIGPLVLTGPQADWTNDVARALMMSLINLKNVIGTTDAQNSQLLKAAKNGDVVQFLNTVDIRTVVTNIQAGGITPEFVTGFQLALESLQRNSGSYQNRQGSVDAQATATAINDAAAGYNAAMAFWSDGFRDWQRQIYEKWAFWTDVSSDVKQRVGPLSPQVMQQLGLRDPYLEVKGGFVKGSKWGARDHDMLDLRISINSGRPQNQETMTQNLQLLMAWVTALGAMPPQLALATDMNAAMKMFARARGWREAERLVDGDLFRQLSAAALQMQNAPQPQPQKPTAQVSFGGKSSGKVAQGPRPTASGSSMSVGYKPSKNGAGAKSGAAA